MKLIAQVGSLDLNEAIELGKYATELGYDALSAVTPFYYPFTFEEIRDYYFDIIEATQNNMIIYAIPDLTCVNISIEQSAAQQRRPHHCSARSSDGSPRWLPRPHCSWSIARCPAPEA